MRINKIPSYYSQRDTHSITQDKIGFSRIGTSNGTVERMKFV